MGLLDEAIREHLDLQRRRGADPAEVERAEREALGPVRRNTAEAEHPEDGADDALADDQEHEPDWGVSSEQQPDPIEPAADLKSPSPPEEPSNAGEGDLLPGTVPPRGPPAPEEPSGSAAPPPPDEPAEAATSGSRPAPAATSPQPSEHEGGATVEYDVQGAPEREGDDVLEETPEFLQETPDHDRLWFEQRPPRDFDFNG